MNDWLSEYEEWIKEQPFSYGYRTKMARMARVIRELAKGNKEAQAICNDTPEESEPRILDGAITEILGVLSDDLSDDAKELVK